MVEEVHNLQAGVSYNKLSISTSQGKVPPAQVESYIRVMPWYWPRGAFLYSTEPLICRVCVPPHPSLTLTLVQRA